MAFMAIIIIFLMGVANFTMHKAVMESGHPAIQSTRMAFQKATGGWGGYILEGLILVAAMSFANAGSSIALLVYTGYTAMNAAAAWVLLKGKM